MVLKRCDAFDVDLVPILTENKNVDIPLAKGGGWEGGPQLAT